jgi:hypothetical protein
MVRRGQRSSIVVALVYTRMGASDAIESSRTRELERARKRHVFNVEQC